jgi:parvulin-like peptidyl-prolyl isomerase
MLALFAACAVLFSVAAQSSPSSLSLKGIPAELTSSSPASPAASAGDEAAEAAIRRALLSQPASEEEIVNALSFMPDVVAEVGGAKITKKEIVDMLMSKKVSQQVLALTPESYLRTAMKQYVDQMIDTAILKQKAKEAGFIPSEQLVKTGFDDAIKKLPADHADEVKDQLKARGLSLEEYRDEIAKEADVQEKAAIAAYEEKNFIAKTEKAIGDDAVEKFYRENQQKFAVPESITVAHILIQCEPVSALDSKEEKEIKTKADKLAKEQIDDIYAALVKDPASFEKLAQEKSNCPSGKRDNGKLPPFDKEGMLLDQSGMLDPDFAAAAFKLEKTDEFTKPVHTQFGYHIIKLLKKDPKGYLPLEKVKGEIHDYLVDKTVSEDIQAMIKAERDKGGIKVYDFTPAKADPKATKNPAAAPTPIL